MATLRPGAIVPPPAAVRPTAPPIRPVTGPMRGEGAIVPPRFTTPSGRRFNRGGMTRGNRF